MISKYIEALEFGGKNVRRAPSLTEESYNRLEGQSTFLPSLQVKAGIFRGIKPLKRAHICSIKSTLCCQVPTIA